VSMRPLIAGFVVAEIVLSATSLVGQTLDIKPPTTGRRSVRITTSAGGKNPL